MASDAGVVFRVVSNDMTVEEISAELDMQPTIAHRAGDRRGPVHSWRENVWDLFIEGTFRDLEAPLRRLCDLLTSRHDQVQALTRRKGVRCILWCSVQAVGPERTIEISSELLEELGRLGAALSISVYSAIASDDA